MRREQMMRMIDDPDGLEGHNARQFITDIITENCRRNPKNKRKCGHKKEFKFVNSVDDIYYLRGVGLNV